MSKKNLLNESQVRQFMKLARLEPLTPGFVGGLTEKQGAVDKEDEHLGAKDGAESGKKQSEKDRRKEMRGEDRAEDKDPAAVEESVDELDETHGRGLNDQGYGVDNTSPGRRVKAMEEASEEDELHATEDELGAEDELADEEGDELADLEGGDDLGAEGGEGRMVSVDDFLAALESTLEGFLDDEVEVDASAMGAEDEVEADVELDAADDEVEISAEDELEEGVFGGKSKADKAREKLALGKKGSYAPDPEAGEKSSAPTPAQMAAAKAADKEPRSRRPRRSASDIAGALGGSWKGISEGGDTDDLVEQITKRVAARILKSALLKK